MRTIIKVDIRHIEYSTRWGLYIRVREAIAIGNRNISEYGSEQQESGVVQEGKHRNAMSEHGTGTGTRIKNRNWDWD